MARLLWSSPHTPKAVVPADRLFQPTNGLTGDYFAGITPTGPAHTRTDGTVNFNWGTGFGDPNVGAELFGVRWTGRITPPFSETYRFYANTDDGVRLWVNDVKLVDDWTDHGPTETSGPSPSRPVSATTSAGSTTRKAAAPWCNCRGQARHYRNSSSRPSASRPDSDQ